MLRAYLGYEPAPGDYDAERTVIRVIAGVECLLRDYGLVRLEDTDATPAGAALLARVEAAERTPETVLRAMLVSYEADAIEKARAYYADPGVDASLLRATNEADTDVEIVRDQLAILLAKGFTTFTVSMSTIGADYATRLAGTTPIDAPPAGPSRARAVPRRECRRCDQWYSYGTGCIGPCKDSTYRHGPDGPGWRDPLHEWHEIDAPPAKEPAR